jgi:hypothetical protein
LFPGNIAYVWHGALHAATVAESLVGHGFTIRASGGQDSETTHSTQKPVDCMRRPMQNNSNHGQAVYDPFLGSGTTLIAAETTGRVCLGMELEPHYVDVAVRRWQAFTGMKACLLDDGRSFEVIADERLPDLQNTTPGSPAAMPVKNRAQE